MGWLVEWWRDERSGNLSIRLHEPAPGGQVRAGLVTVSDMNAVALLGVLRQLCDVEVRRVRPPRHARG